MAGCKNCLSQNHLHSRGEIFRKEVQHATLDFRIRMIFYDSLAEVLKLFCMRRYWWPLPNMIVGTKHTSRKTVTALKLRLISANQCEKYHWHKSARLG